MRPELNILIMFSILFYGISLAEPAPIYLYYHSSNIFHIDVYQEKLEDIVAYINQKSKANIVIDKQIKKGPITVRCEARWLCGGIIFFNTASFRSGEYRIHELPAPSYKRF